ncbi:MAG TPA: pyridoxal phosphate-dependent aminotransferase [Gemmatimonadaceae bacterium]|nr:pyridoxal phosphate-dependent aminotransferase [Gemmatimonadaceae bacterium]
MPDEFVPSPNIAQLRPSATIAVSARAKALKAQGRQIIDLGVGEPDFDTPDFVKAAAARAVASGHTRYTATEGVLPLREAIASHAAARWAGPVADAPAALDVVVSNGSKQTLFNACFCLFGPGDEVLIPTPAWTSYVEIVALARATPVAVMGDPANAFQVTVADLEAAATPRTKGLMLNSPSNPTGATWDADVLRDILAFAASKGWWVLSDEIYRRISYEVPAASALELTTDRSRLIVIDGVAKSYAMTGWRIGWAVAPRAIAKAMTDLQSHTTSNASTPSQYAALAALTERDAAEESITAMVRAFRARRDAAKLILDQEGAPPYIDPSGAFYFFIDVSAIANGGDDAGTLFAAEMLEQHGVAIVPGAAFGTPNWVRLSYAAAEADVLEAMRRIVSAYRAMMPVPA